MLCERAENVEELIDQVQGQQLLGLLGPGRARLLAAPLRPFVPQVGHPQGVQQADDVGEQLGLQEPEAKRRTLPVTSPLLLASAGAGGGGRGGRGWQDPWCAAAGQAVSPPCSSLCSHPPAPRSPKQAHRGRHRPEPP